MSVAIQQQPQSMEVANVYARNSSNNDSDDATATDVVTVATKVDKTAEVFSPQLLQMYYSRFFPYSLMHSWLSYGNQDPTVFSRREFSFTLDVGGDEIYLRYQSFKGADDLQQAILNRRPAKIDIGAVFSHDPSQKNTLPESRFQPVQREFVLDVDLTDYDDVRQCGCSGAKICGKCWKFMNMAVKVMDEGMRQDFGFEHISWFYSGRRGVHAWVCDESARMLTDEGRSAVASYFEVDLGSDRNKEVKISHPLHPMLRRAHATLEPMFIESVLPEDGHGLLAKQELWEQLLDTLPEGAEVVSNKLKTELASKKGMAMSPAEKWEMIKMHIEAYVGHKAGQKKSAKRADAKLQDRVEIWPVEVVFRYTYPRLDINVSKKRNHLLKSPFCVHPKTGRVCVPIQHEKIEAFDPFAVPTLDQLMSELDNYERENGKDTDSEKEQREIPNWQKTSLKDYFVPFQKDFLEPMQKHFRRKERDASEEEAAVIGDF
mmetsp:Transcript_3658/g.10062  ORF Transcript_3658/g.10062 Transcript_3658/m.10062 type:complete len:488 (+) Transcript_3658:70-1533(+)